MSFSFLPFRLGIFFILVILGHRNEQKIEKACPQNMLDFRVGLSKPRKLTFLEDKISYLFFTPEAQEYRNEKKTSVL